MKKLFICQLLVVGSQLFCFSQKVDSLNSALLNAKHDTVKLRILVELSEECAAEDILKYAEPAAELADKLLQDKKILNQKS